MRKAEALATVALPECADSIESHPWLDNVFALATYQVDQQEVDRELGNGKDEQEGEPEASSSSSSPPYTRKGLLRLYRGTLQGDGSVDCLTSYEEQTAAILDTKWSLASPSSSPAARGLLGVADASGHVSLHSLQPDPADSSWRLPLLAKLPFNGHKSLCLSLDWSDRISHYPPRAAAAHVQDASLIVSQSDGSLAWLPSVTAAVTADEATLKTAMDMRFPRGTQDDEKEEQEDDDGEEEEDGDDAEEASPRRPSDWPEKPIGLETWHAHDHEAWIAAFDAHSDGRIIWSGGDDLAMKGWDVRTPIRRRQRSPTFTNRREFQGGVTTMQSHWAREGLWAVGSYDSKLRLFEARLPARPLATMELPGGIWRLKWHPTDPSLLLAGCMHGGFAVVRVPWLAGSADSDDADKSSLEIISTFEGHESLAYGCDWERGNSGTVKEWATGASVSFSDGIEPSLVYSCSFYDKRLCSWLA